MSLNLKNMSTETRNQNTMNLDIMSPLEVVTVMNQEDAKVPAAIAPALPNIAQCVTWAIESIENGGRIIYMGAGTSGRLGVLDAVECPPTFGVAPEVVVGLIAGGEKAFVKAVEGAEDSRELGRQDLIDNNLTKTDIVIGIAASGRTPYVLGGLAYAQEVGCHTVGISCNPGSAVGAAAELAIEVVPGPECLTGSTRLKAGTCQKMILNMISTITMAQRGNVYQNLMINVPPVSVKMRKRLVYILTQATGCSMERAQQLMEECEFKIKPALLMELKGMTKEEALAELEKVSGNINHLV